MGGADHFWPGTHPIAYSLPGSLGCCSRAPLVICPKENMEMPYAADISNFIGPIEGKLTETTINRAAKLGIST